MNNIENQLSELIKKAIEVAEKTGEFAIEQAPLLLQEFYKWHIAENIFLIIISIIFFIIGRYLPYLWLNEFNEHDDTKFFKKSGDESALFAYAFFIALSIMSSATFLIAVYDLVYLIVAPKLYLIDYFIK